MIKSENNSLKMTIKTLNTPANGMFYYKNDLNPKKVKTIEATIKEDTYFYRTRKNNIQTFNNHSNFSLKEEEEILFRVRKNLKKKNYEIINPINKGYKINKFENNNNFLHNKIWYTLKTIKTENYNYEENTENYKLNENDIIKIGNKKYEIIKLHINKKENNQSSENNNDNNTYNISELNKNSEPIFNINLKENQYQITQNESKIDDNERCWICLDGCSTEENPKLSLCKCHSYVHFECLKSYLSKKFKIQYNSQNTITSFTCQKFNCDICLAPYPVRFRIPKLDKIYEFVDLNLPEENDYLVLESLDYIKKNINLKTLYLIQLLDKEITLGRHSENDISIRDLTVSRFHAVLKYDKENGNLFLENKSEKFGTLVLIRGNLKIKEEKINFQIGRSYVTAYIDNQNKNNIEIEHKKEFISNKEENKNEKVENNKEFDIFNENNELEAINKKDDIGKYLKEEIPNNDDETQKEDIRLNEKN